ncbi:MAG: hypothetical protein ACLQU2_07520 [Candidatus Binataceae bacterium]
MAGTIHNRDRNGRPDEWIYRLGKGDVKREFDTNGDGRPDLVKFYQNNQLIRVERDRNFDGKPDLIQEYDRGVIVREIHDDDFDGKPEMIKIFRKGVLAILERDPQERGVVDIAEYYDDRGNLVRREVRQK